jgi:hypothetical protein
MTTEPSTPRHAWWNLAVPAILAILAGCMGAEVQEVSDRAAARYLHNPVSRAMSELGAPQRQRPIADLHEYTWTTGVSGGRGGDCTLALIADRSGVVVDYRMYGTPLGCNRLVAKA